MLSADQLLRKFFVMLQHANHPHFKVHLNIEQKVQECDAIRLNSSTAARLIKIPYTQINLLNILSSFAVNWLLIKKPYEKSFSS